MSETATCWIGEGQVGAEQAALGPVAVLAGRRQHADHDQQSRVSVLVMINLLRLLILFAAS